MERHTDGLVRGVVLVAAAGGGRVCEAAAGQDAAVDVGGDGAGLGGGERSGGEARGTGVLQIENLEGEIQFIDVYTGFIMGYRLAIAIEKLIENLHYYFTIYEHSKSEFTSII